MHRIPREWILRIKQFLREWTECKRSARLNSLREDYACRRKIGLGGRNNGREIGVLSAAVSGSSESASPVAFGHTGRRSPAFVLLFAMALGFLQLLVCLKLYPDQSPQGQTRSNGEEEVRSRQANTWSSQGMTLYARGDYYGAAQVFEKVYSLYPENPDVAFNYGLTLQALGRFETALTPLLKATRARPEDSAAQLSLGVCYLGLGRLSEGVTRLEKSLTGDPANIQTLFYLAVAYHRLQRNGDANDRLRWMAERNPRSPLTYLYTARALRMASKFEEAEIVIRKSLELDSNSAEAYFEQGCIERCLGRPEQAERAFQEALRIHPEMPNAAVELGEVILNDRNDPQAALVYFQRVFQFNPSDARAEFDLGEAYLKTHQVQAAQDALVRAIELKPDFSQAHYLLGSILQRLGRREQAEREFALAKEFGSREHDPRIQNFQTPLTAQ